MHAVGAGPLVGACGTKGATSAWGGDIDCIECMQLVAKNPLLLLVDGGARANGMQRMKALVEAQQIWARLWSAGHADGIRSPSRSSVADPKKSEVAHG